MTSLFTIQTPVLRDNHDGGAGIATSTRIKIGTAGTVPRVRWWATDTISTDDAYVAELWSLTADAVGTMLASRTIGPIVPGQVVPGWNLIDFVTPVPVTPGVYAPVIINYGTETNGKYVLANHLFDTAIVNGDLRGLADGEVVGGQAYSNGCFHVYSSTVGIGGVLPTDTFNNGCYFVDLDFVPVGAGRVPDFAAFF